MRVGQYIRCPILYEEVDRKFPRIFVMAQIVAIDDAETTATIALHDFKNTKERYPHVFANTVFPLSQVARCVASSGSLVVTPDGRGKILAARAAKEEETSSQYFVQLADGQIRQYLEDVLQIQYASPDFSPAVQMLQYELQNPSWYRQRIHVSSYLHRMEDAAYGFDILASCRILLLKHQADAIMQALETRPIRRVLADEGGLGKRIEACSLLKILRSEKEELRALLIVPRTSVRQWVYDLKSKFYLDASETIQDTPGNYILVAEELSADAPALRLPWDLLVIDAAHRIVRDPEKYALAAALSKRTPGALVLTATPLPERAEEYLRILRLCLPVEYESMTVESFSAAAAQQRVLQQRVNAVTRRVSAYESNYEDSLEELNALAADLNDPTLRDMCRDIAAATGEEGKNGVRQALGYIAETYRIAPKVVRNRYTGIKAGLFGKRLFISRSYSLAPNGQACPERDVYNTLVRYLTRNTDRRISYAREVARPLLMAMASSPWALKECVSKLAITEGLLNRNIAAWVAQANHEITHVNYLLDENPDKIKCRLLMAVDYIEQEIDIGREPRAKIVAFTHYRSTLEHFLLLLQARNIGAALFHADMTEEERVENIYRFQTDPQCRVLVCDETGGDGRSLHHAEWILHLDIPWTAGEMERRIGRLDRFGRADDRKEIISVVFYAEDTVEEQLLHIWDRDLDMFREPLGALEILADDIEEKILQALADDPAQGLTHAGVTQMLAEVRGALTEERLYDATAIYSNPSQMVDRLLRVCQGEDGKAFQAAMLQWARQSGLTPMRTAIPLVIQFTGETFNPRGAMRSLLISPDWSVYASVPVVRRENKIMGTFDRAMAGRREDLLFFAPGDDVYESIIENAISNGRGRCCAYSTNGPFSYLGFVFTFNVEPDRWYLLEQEVPLTLLSQFSAYLPLRQTRVLIPFRSEYGKIPDAAVLEAMLATPLRKTVHLGRRAPERGGESAIQRFMDAYPEKEWRGMVRQATAMARKLATERCANASDLAGAKREVARILSDYAPGYAWPESVYQAVLSALAHPHLVLDSLCMLRITPKKDAK